MVTANDTPFIGRRAAWLTLFVVLLIALTMVLAPVWIIRPFKPQTQRGLEVSYAMRRWSPIITLLASAAALALAILLWRSTRRWWPKAALVVIILPLLAATWLARQNHFEWMFHPLANAAYAKTGEAGFVTDNDVVLAVESNGEAVAYPVRLMAYHHVVQDVVGGTPIVATY